MMNNSQVTVPRYRENPLIIPFSMLCPGISQNTKLHHLTLYKGQVWGEKSYLELCNHNLLNIVIDPETYDPIEENGTLYVPPVPGIGFISDNSMIPYDSEILQSFTELNDITNMTFLSFDQRSLVDVTYQIQVGSYMCGSYRVDQCAPPYKYIPWYIWTKEGFKIQLKLFRFKNNIFSIFPYLF